MDFTIRNKYLKKFLSNFSNRNPIKLMKYLSIIGVDALRKNSKSSISYEELQQLAKRIAGTERNGKKTFENELANIKNEIANLNAKFDQKLNKLGGSEKEYRAFAKDTTAQTKNKITEERDNKFTSQGKAERDVGISAGKPATTNKDKGSSFPRSSSVEANIYPAWWGYLEPEETEKDKKKLTGKITQSEAPYVPRSREKVISRHHLDDELSRSVFVENPMDSAEDEYPTRDKNNSRDLDRSQSQKINTTQETGQMTADFRKMERGNHTSNHLDQAPVKARPQPSYFVPFSKSTNKKSKTSQDTSNNNKSRNSSTRPHSRDRNLFLSHASVPPEKKEKPTQNPQYSHIQSKIKDKVALDKELSRQYKRIKGVMHDQPGDHGDSFQTSGFGGSRQNGLQLSENEYLSREKLRSQNQSKFIFLDKGDNRSMYTRSPMERGSPARTTNQGSRYQHEESNYNDGRPEDNQPYSAESASPIRNQRGYSPYRLNRSPYRESYSRGEQYSANKSDETNSQFRDSRFAPQTRGLAGKGGNDPANVLEIANNFINSPLMQHLSSQDQKQNSEHSLKGSSSFPNTLKSNVDVTGFETRSPSTFTRSPNSRRYYNEEIKNSEEKGQRYSDWVGVYNFSKSRDQPSYLKDSKSKRMSDYKRKDSGDVDNDDSFSSSTFSNFNLNEDMRGFYQNIFWEQNKKNETSDFRRRGLENPEDENTLDESYADGNYQNDRSLRYKSRIGNASRGSYADDYGNHANRSNRYAGVGGSGHKAGRSSAGRYANYS